MKKLLITGSSGFVGKKLLKSFSENQEIYTYETTRFKDKINPKSIYLDLNNKNSIDEVFNKYEINSIIHLGGCSSPIECEESPNHTYKTNVIGTLYLAEKAKKNNLSCFINFSSNKSINPKSFYGKQKQEIENELIKLSSLEFNCISYRCGNILKSPNSFLFDWYKMYENNLCIKSSGKGVKRNFISLDNVVKDLNIINSNQKKFHNCIVIPQMKEGEIYSFLKTFANTFKTEIKTVSNRKIDNLNDFIIHENEIKKVKLKSVKNRIYGLINNSFKSKLIIEINKTLLKPIFEDEIKSIIESIK